MLWDGAGHSHHQQADKANLYSFEEIHLHGSHLEWHFPVYRLCHLDAKAPKAPSYKGHFLPLAVSLWHWPCTDRIYYDIRDQHHGAWIQSPHQDGKACLYITTYYPVFEWLNQESNTYTFLGLNSNLYCSVIPIITSSSDLRRWPKVKMYTKTKHNLHNTRDKVSTHIYCRPVITLTIRIENKILFRGVLERSNLRFWAGISK